MTIPMAALPAAPAGVAPDEWRARLELAACYRLFARLGWAESIFNHITVRVPGTTDADRQYLINPFGLLYEEVTASNLVKVDLQGRPVGDPGQRINPAGFIIHSAVHAARADAHCVIHTHTTTGIAVAVKQGGLRHDNFYSAQLAGRIAYHAFEGITVHADEQPRLVHSLGARDVLILRNHGLMVVGPDLPSAFHLMWTLQRACDVQAMSDGMAGSDSPVDEAVAARCREDAANFDAHLARLAFDAALRRYGVSLAQVGL